MYACMYIHSMSMQQWPHSTLKGYQDTINHWDIFRATIVIVNFLALKQNPQLKYLQCVMRQTKIF